MLTRHSSVFQIISWNPSTAKCRQRKSSDTLYYFAICATLCVSFSSKPKPTNVFAKHIRKHVINQFKQRRNCFVTRSKELFVQRFVCKFLIKFESTSRREIKGQTLQLTLLYCGRTVRSSHRRFSIKKAVLKNFTITTGNTWVGVSKDVVGLKACNFIKTRPQHRCFPVNLVKSLRLLVSKNICERLLFDCFNGSLLHGPKGSRSRLHDRVWLQGLSHRSSFFVFKSGSLVLNQVLTCVLKCKTITFDESIKFLHWLFLVVLDGFRSF